MPWELCSTINFLKNFLREREVKGKGVGRGDTEDLKRAHTMWTQTQQPGEHEWSQVGRLTNATQVPLTYSLYTPVEIVEHQPQIWPLTEPGSV